jgi:hypothetical protein
MNDRELEDRIRASLQARAGDVQPTPRSGSACPSA